MSTCEGQAAGSGFPVNLQEKCPPSRVFGVWGERGCPWSPAVERVAGVRGLPRGKEGNSPHFVVQPVPPDAG